VLDAYPDGVACQARQPALAFACGNSGHHREVKSFIGIAYAFTGGRGEWALTKPGEIGLTPTERAAEGIHQHTKT
jgi:hypothetical protein